MEEQLLELPEKIRNLSLDILVINQQVQDLEFKQEVTKNKTFCEIVDEKDKNDKPLYSNETKRRDELNKRLELDSEYQQQDSELKQSKITYQKMTINLEMLNNKQKNFRALCYLNNPK